MFVKSKCVAIAFETVTAMIATSTFAPMSEVAGKFQLPQQLPYKVNGGRGGILLAAFLNYSC